MADKGLWTTDKKRRVIESTLILYIFFILVSCTSFDDKFNQLVKIEEPDFLPVVGPEGPTDNKLYLAIFTEGKKNNQVLLERVMYTNKTNWYLHSSNVQLTDGDVALCLLFDINTISDTDMYELMPDYLTKEYKENGSKVWWNWIHKDNNNRKWVLSKLSSIILN